MIVMVKEKRKSFFQILFYSSFFSIILILILVLVLVSFSKTFIQERGIRGQIIALENEIRKIEGERTKLFEALDYLKSDFYKEKEAREKLGLQKKGEKTIVILPPEKEEVKKEKEEKEEDLPIFKKWWQYLFRK